MPISTPVLRRFDPLFVDRVGGALATQLLQSAVALLVAAIFVRALSLSDFGLYTLGVSIGLVSVGMVDSLLITPLMTRAARFGPVAGSRRLSRSLGGIHLGVAVCSGAVGGLAYTAAGVLNIAPDQAMPIALAATGIGIMGGARETARTILLLSGNARGLMRLETAASVLTLGAALALLAWHPAPRAVDALLCSALSALVYFGYLVTVTHRQRAADAWRLLVLGSRRGFGLFAASQVSWLQSQSYLYFLTAMVSPAALGQVAAARLLFAPLYSVSTGFAKGALPSIAQARRHGTGGRNRAIWRAYAAVALIGTAWTAAAIGLHDMIFGLLKPDAQVATVGIVAAWGLLAVASLLRTVGATVLKAIEAYRALFVAGCVGAIVSMTTIPLFIGLLGAAGALLGVAAAEGVATALAHRKAEGHADEA